MLIAFCHSLAGGINLYTLNKMEVKYLSLAGNYTDDSIRTMVGMADGDVLQFWIPQRSFSPAGADNFKDVVLNSFEFRLQLLLAQ